MRRHRWGWRIAAISPAVIVLGLVGAGTALASGSSSTGSCTTSGGLVGQLVGGVCQTVTSPGSILPSPVASLLPSPVASVAGSAGSTVGSTVGSVTGSSGSSGGSSGSGSTGSSGSGGTSSGGSSSHSKTGGSRQHSQASASAIGLAGSPSAGVLSSLGVPAWLVRGGLGALPGSTVPLSFPVVHPSHNSRTVAQQIRASNQPRAVSSLWLVFAVGVACLVGVAGGLGRFEGRRVRRIPG